MESEVQQMIFQKKGKSTYPNTYFSLHFSSFLWTMTSHTCWWLGQWLGALLYTSLKPLKLRNCPVRRRGLQKPPVILRIFREERFYNKKSTKNLIWPKRPWTLELKRRKNKVSKRPIDLTGSNKVPIVGKCPVNTSPATL